MTSSSFYEEGSKVLTPGAFEFVLDSELKRAVRSQNFLTLVVVEAKSKPNPNPLEKIFSHSQHEVCWITSTQLTRVAREYSTGWMTISVDDEQLDLVTVDGANDHDLRAMLGPRGMTCRLVRVSATFFLPFDAHGS